MNVESITLCLGVKHHEQGRPKQHKENMPYRFVKGHGTGQSLAFEYSSKKINYPEMQDFEPEFYGMRT